MRLVTLKLKQQQRLKKIELKFVYFKVLQVNYKVPFAVKKSSVFGSKFKTQTFKSNRCFITGISSSVYKPWNLSRFFLRALIAQGHILGLKKSSW